MQLKPELRYGYCFGMQGAHGTNNLYQKISGQAMAAWQAPTAMFKL